MKQAQSHLFTGWRASAVWRENRLSWKKNNLASPELALTLPSQVSNQPMGVEGILRGHPPAHDGIEEGFPLAGVEPQDLGILEETAWDSPQWRKHCMSQKWELSEKSLQIIAQLGTIYRMKNDPRALNAPGGIHAATFQICREFIPQCCPRPGPVREAEVCLSHSSSADATVCVHLRKNK